MMLEATCLTDWKKRKITYWKDSTRLETEVKIFREFTIYSDADKQLHVELNLDMRRGVRSVGKTQIATRMPLDLVMQNNNMLTADDIIKIEFDWVDVKIYDKVLNVDLNLGEIRAFSQLTEKDVEEICTAIEVMCEV